jgi:hypothetical protein
VDIFAIGAIIFLTFARLAIISFEMSSPQLVQILKTSTCPEVDIATFASRTSIWYFASIVLS